MGHEVVPADSEADKGVLYTLDKGSICEKFKPVTISNGLAWNADDTIMYYIDSIPRHVYAFDYDKATGGIGKQDRRTFI